MAADFLFWFAGEGLPHDRLAFQACVSRSLMNMERFTGWGGGWLVSRFLNQIHEAEGYEQKVRFLLNVTHYTANCNLFVIFV